METAPSDKLPKGLLLNWYGDDFTGSAAVMEVLTFAGVPSVLFLQMPTEDQRKRFPDAQAIGIASTARSRGPAWMDENLPDIFRYLAAMNAQVTHYKVCSTLDSSTETGSIGKAIDIAAEILSPPWIPLLVAAPAMGRYQAFGNLFASSPAGIQRLDRHPVMARHPVTPMDEADVGRHVARQTRRKIGAIDFAALQSDEAADAALQNQREDGAEIISLDSMDDKSEAAAGRLIWRDREDGIFAVGSQGVEYALAAHWRETGLLAEKTHESGVEPADRIAVVSGSVASITAQQIGWAIDHGFADIPFDAAAVCGSVDDGQKAEDNSVDAALVAVANGRDPLIHTARGPDDDAVIAYRASLVRNELSAEAGNHRIGASLGRILDRILRQTGINRAVICGGDTSGHAMAQLGVFALTAIAPTVPGAALCKAHSDDPVFAGLELALKGGQMGTPDFLGWIKRGGGTEKRRTQKT